MSHTLFSLPTYTAAAMAHDILAGHNILSDIVRTSADRMSSCGYSVRIDSRNRQNAEMILRQSRAAVLKITEWQS